MYKSTLRAYLPSFEVGVGTLIVSDQVAKVSQGLIPPPFVISVALKRTAAKVFQKAT